MQNIIGLGHCESASDNKLCTSLCAYDQITVVFTAEL